MNEPLARPRHACRDIEGKEREREDRKGINLEAVGLRPGAVAGCNNSLWRGLGVALLVVVETIMDLFIYLFHCWRLNRTEQNKTEEV